MSAQEIVFLLLAIGTSLTAIMTVTSRNLVHAALFLAMTLAGIAGVFFVLHADFVGLVQLVVYVGAIAVLFLFGLMLTRAPIGREALDSQNRGMGAVVAGVLFVVLVTLIVEAFRDATAVVPDGASVADLGLAIFSSWVLPFELASMLLLGALIGAVLLSRRESGESGTETPVTRIDVGQLDAQDRAELELTSPPPTPGARS
jgi:NADH-quinone oxidoreductase subunit J